MLTPPPSNRPNEMWPASDEAVGVAVADAELAVVVDGGRPLGPVQPPNMIRAPPATTADPHLSTKDIARPLRLLKPYGTASTDRVNGLTGTLRPQCP
jgi:hypothetical protein